jgi:hypothetical protein
MEFCPKVFALVTRSGPEQVDLPRSETGRMHRRQVRAYMFVARVSDRIASPQGTWRKPCFLSVFGLPAGKEVAMRETGNALAWVQSKAFEDFLACTLALWKMFSIKLQGRWQRECYEFRKHGFQVRWQA